LREIGFVIVLKITYTKIPQMGDFWYNVVVELKDKKRIGILRGGMGDFYETSLKEGGDIILYLLDNLSEKLKVIDTQVLK